MHHDSPMQENPESIHDTEMNRRGRENSISIWLWKKTVHFYFSAKRGCEGAGQGEGETLSSRRKAL